MRTPRGHDPEDCNSLHCHTSPLFDIAGSRLILFSDKGDGPLYCPLTSLRPQSTSGVPAMYLCQ
jgi:hypothetical protein